MRVVFQLMVSTAFTAALIRASLEGLAGLSANRLISGFDAARELDGVDGWRTHQRNQLAGLVSALDDESPAGFAAKCAWSRDAFAARAVSIEPLQAALACLREVLEESLPPEAWSSLPPYFEHARRELSRPAAASPCEISGDDPQAVLARAYVDALRACDEERAFSVVLGEIDAQRLTVEAALERVVIPAQCEIGRLWHRGELGVAEEHFATGVTRRAIERIMARAPRVERTRWTVVTASVAGDAHDIGVSLVSAFFELAGWRAISLGSNAPAEDIVRMLERVHADVVALGATIDVQREAATRTIALIRAARPKQRVIVGGGAFKSAPQAWRRAGADAYAGSPREAVEIAKRLVTG